MFLITVKKIRLFLSVIIEGSVVTALLPIYPNSKLPFTVGAAVLFGPGKRRTSFQSTHKFPMSTHIELRRWKLQGLYFKGQNIQNMIPNRFPDSGIRRKDPGRKCSG